MMMYNSFWARVTDVVRSSFFGGLLLKLIFCISSAFKNSWLYSYFVSRDMSLYAQSSRVCTSFRKLIFNSKLTNILSDSVFVWFFNELPNEIMSVRLSSLALYFLPAALLMFISVYGSLFPMIIASIIIFFGIILVAFKSTIGNVLNNSFLFNNFIKLFDFDPISEKCKRPIRVKIVLLLLGIIVGASSFVLEFNLSLALFVGLLLLIVMFGSPLLLISLSFLLGITFSSMPAFVFCFLSSVIVFCRLIAKKEQLPKLRVTYLLVSVYALIVLFFTFFGSAGSDSFLAGFIQFVLLSSFFSIVIVVNSFDKFKKLINIMTVFSLVPAFAGLVQLFSGGGGTGWSAQNHVGGLVRIVSTFSNPNVFGEFILVSFALSVVSVLISKSWYSRIFYFVCTALQLVNLVITYSRGCYIACLVSLLIIIWCCDKRILSFAVFAIPVLPKILPQNMLARILTVGSYLKDTSVLYRFSIWKGALRIVKNHWYFASGIGTVAFSMFYRIYMFAGTPAQHSHNTFIQLTVEIGLIGLLIFLMIYFFTLKDICNVVSQSNIKSKFIIIPMFSSMIAMLVQSLFDYVFYNNIIFMSFWMSVALVVAALNVVSSNIEFKKPEENV